MNFHERFGEKLRNARKASAFKKQVAAAEQTSQIAKDEGCQDFGVDDTLISRYEHAKSWPTIPKLLALARVYGKPLSEFFAALGAKPEELCAHKDGRPEIGEAEESRYAEKHQQDHNWLEWILTRGTTDQTSGIRSNLKAFVQAIYMDSGVAPEGFVSKKDAKSTGSQGETDGPMG